MIRRCHDAEIREILEIVNDAARAYEGVIPADCWHEPYMQYDELCAEIDDGVVFWGLERGERLLGIMGLQDCGDVTLVRHAYVRSEAQRAGIGSGLLGHLERLTARPVLIGTWAAASWAIAFYQRHGYALLADDECHRVLRRYWSIPERQVETSVVLASAAWWASAARRAFTSPH